MRTKFAIALVILTAAACGKSEQQKAAEQAAAASQQAAQATQQAAQQIAQGAQQMAQGAQQAAQGGAQGIAAGLQAMAQGLGRAATGPDGKPIQPVDFEKLIALLPDAPGWSKDKPKGGNQSGMGFSFANAETDYRKGDSHIHLEITDGALNGLFSLPFSMMLASGYNERTSEGFKRATTVNGSPAYEEWTNDSKRGEVGVFVANRFLVSGKGSGFDNIEAIRSFVSQVDFGKLAATK